MNETFGYNLDAINTNPINAQPTNINDGDGSSSLFYGNKRNPTAGQTVSGYVYTHASIGVLYITFLNAILSRITLLTVVAPIYYI